MSRLFLSTVFRMLKKFVFWILMICMFAYGVYSASNAASEARAGFALDGCFFEFVPFVGLAAAVLVSLFVGSEYSDGTIRNKLVVGHSRMRIYLANLIACSIACILISLAYVAGVIIVGNSKGGELLTAANVVFMCLICSFWISIAFASIMTMLAMLNTNKAGNAVVSMLLALILLVSSSFIYQRLREPKVYDHYVSVSEAGIPTQVEELPNPLYIDGTPRAVLEVVNDLLPSGQAMQLADAFDSEGIVNKNIENTPYRWLGYSFLMIVLTSGMGIALFRKKEIR